MPARPAHALPPLQTARGLTLVEVLVALAAMALLSALSWRGLDAMSRSRIASERTAQEAARLSATVSQWESDLGALVATGATPALRFDGATLRLTREGAQASAPGVQVVAWSLHEGAWWRWAGPPVTQAAPLREQWQAAGVWALRRAQALQMLPQASQVQVYFHRDNAWTHAQSSGDRLAPQAATGMADGDADEQLPGGVRLVLDLPAGALTRDIVLSPQGP